MLPHPSPLSSKTTLEDSKERMTIGEKCLSQKTKQNEKKQKKKIIINITIQLGLKLLPPFCSRISLLQKYYFQ